MSTTPPLQDDERGLSLLAPGEWAKSRVGQRGTLVRRKGEEWVLRLADGSEADVFARDLTLLRSKRGVTELLAQARALLETSQGSEGGLAWSQRAAQLALLEAQVSGQKPPSHSYADFRLLLFKKEKEKMILYLYLCQGVG